jgi:hypothetical protein
MISWRRRLDAEMNSQDPAADQQRLQTFRGQLQPFGPEPVAAAATVRR